MIVPYTINNVEGSTYPCFNGTVCHTSWTYDNHHCTWCHWKGLGVEDVRHGGPEYVTAASKVREMIFFKLSKPIDKP